MARHVIAPFGIVNVRELPDAAKLVVPLIADELREARSRTTASRCGSALSARRRATRQRFVAAAKHHQREVAHVVVLPARTR